MHRGTYFTVIIQALLFFSLACNSDKHKGELQFYYYPTKNVYYDPVKKEFLYSLNGAKSWNTFTDTSVAEPATIGEKVVIFSKNREVYKDNENHRKLYGGKLFDISSADTDSAAIAPEATERKVEQKRKQMAVKRPVAKKTGNNIGRFFKKLFGKHR